MKRITFSTVTHWLVRCIINVVAAFLMIGFFIIAQVAWAGLVYRPPVQGILLLLFLLTFTGVLIAVTILTHKKKLIGIHRWYATAVLSGLLFCAVAQLFAINQTAPSTLALFLGAAPGQFLVFGVIGGVVTLVSAFKKLRRTTIVIGGSSGLILLSASVVLIAQLSFAAQHGVAVNTQEVLSSEDQLVEPATTQYINVENKKLAIAIWPGRAIEKPQPAIVLIHGGGYGAGSAIDMKNQATYLSRRGYPVFSVEYRLAPPERWDDASQDIVAGMQWIRDNGKPYYADVNRTVLIGVSAGGGLSLNVGYLLKQGNMSSSLGGVIPPAPVGVAGIFPAADLRGIYNSTEFQNPQPIIQAFTGGTPQQVPAHYDYADPSSKVTRGLMPTFLLTGANDHLIYKETVTGFADKLRANGNSVDSYVLPFGDHSFDARYNSPASAIERGLLTRWLMTVAPLQ